jgi:signal transduction histidine kinase
MLRTLALVAFAALVLATAAFAAGEYGTAEEARAMLDKAVAAVKADKAKALEMFNKADGGFRDRDLYVFCANASDGVTTAHPAIKDGNLKDIKDVNGFAFGQEMMRTAVEGKISEVAYMYPRPGSDQPVQKVAFVTKVGGQICGVGYYK